MVSIRSLGEETFQSVHKAFQRAFADYARDMSYLTESRFQNRMIKNGVDLGVSRGVYSDGDLVGFTLIGVGRHGGVPAAFDAGTGIIPAFRGQGLGPRMLEDALPVLRPQGIERFYLEVLQENEPAIRAYEKTGFAITRDLDCFSLRQQDFRGPSQLPAGAEIVDIPREALSGLASWVAFDPSWENSFDSMRRIPDDLMVLGAQAGSETLGFLAYYPALNWILAAAPAPGLDEEGILESLLAALVTRLRGHTEETNFFNVDRRDREMRRFLDRSGFELRFSQYEMMRLL